MQRLEVFLVSHFLAVTYPVTEIQPGQPGAPAFGDLPQDAESAIPGVRHFAIVKRVNGRESIIQHVNDADHAQHAIFAELHQAAGDMRLQQELHILLAAVLIHAASRMAFGLIVAIQQIVLLMESEVTIAGGQ